MHIKPSAAIRQNYNEVSALCKKTQEPVYLTKNGEGEMLELREDLIRVEEDRLAGRGGSSPDELDSHLCFIVGQKI